MAAATAFADMDAGDETPTPWASLGGATGLRLNAHPRAEMRLVVAGETLTAPLVDADVDADVSLLVTDDEQIVVFNGGDAFAFSRPMALASTPGGGVSDGQLLSPMPGRIVSVGAETGAKVGKGQAIVTLEAMKMEHALVAPFDGTVADLNAKAGDQVFEGVVLARIDKAG